MADLLSGKTAIQEYLQIGDKALDYSIDNLNFPCFVIGNKICSHKGAIDRWAQEMADARIGVDQPIEGSEFNDATE